MVQLEERIQHTSAATIEGPLDAGGQKQYTVRIGNRSATLPVINAGLDRRSSIEEELSQYDTRHGTAEQHHFGDDTVRIYTAADRYLVVVTGPNSIQRTSLERGANE